MKRTAFFTAVITVLFVSQIAYCQKQQFIYQLKIYHLETTGQEEILDNFLRSAYLPAMHRAGIADVGVFKPIKADSSEIVVYVFIPFKTIDQFVDIEKNLPKDKQYVKDGKAYLNAKHDNPPYRRIESILLKSFSGMPAPKVPDLKGPKNERVYELRSYESATESYFRNKVEMFNEGNEIAIFSTLHFNAIFYGEVLSGSHMPNLMYMTSFNNREDRDRHWKAFGEDEAWTKLKNDPKYQNNVSKADIFLLYPADYSDF